MFLILILSPSIPGWRKQEPLHQHFVTVALILVSSKQSQTRKKLISILFSIALSKKKKQKTNKHHKEIGLKVNRKILLTKSLKNFDTIS